MNRIELVKNIKFEFDVILRGLQENRDGSYNSLVYKAYSHELVYKDNAVYKLHYKENTGYFPSININREYKTIDCDLYMDNEDYRFQIDIIIFDNHYFMLNVKLSLFNLYFPSYYGLTLNSPQYMTGTPLEKRCKLYKNFGL